MRYRTVVELVTEGGRVDVVVNVLETPGIAMLAWEDTIGEVYRLVVAPEHRYKGHASRLWRPRAPFGLCGIPRTGRTTVKRSRALWAPNVRRERTPELYVTYRDESMYSRAMALSFSTRIGPGFTTTPTFEAFDYPAGEAHVVVANENTGKGHLTEIARLTGAGGQDLMTLAMWADACHQRGSRTVLLAPYLPGARQDRGIPFGAQVYADHINLMGLDQVIAFDVHSHVMEGLVNNLTILDAARLIRSHVTGRADSDTNARPYAGIICPDEGAAERTARIGRAAHLPVYQARKHRDEATGRLSGFSCETLPVTGRFLVVDDICDGGGTFRGLADVTSLSPERIDLFVSHGVFSGRAPELEQSFGRIISTDSYGPAPETMTVITIPLAPYLLGAIA